MKPNTRALPPVTATIGHFITGKKNVARHERKTGKFAALINAQQRIEIRAADPERQDSIAGCSPRPPRRLTAGNAINEGFARFERGIGKCAGNVRLIRRDRNAIRKRIIRRLSEGRRGTTPEQNETQHCRTVKYSKIPTLF